VIWVMVRVRVRVRIRVAIIITSKNSSYTDIIVTPTRELVLQVSD
jgi:superfamily II DNA/RNA helicase